MINRIEFLKAARLDDNTVAATYALEGTEFTVEWNNVHPATGEVGDYDLQIATKSSDGELACRVDDAINEGETDSNPDLELYLFIRDTFDRMDCARFDPLNLAYSTTLENPTAFFNLDGQRVALNLVAGDMHECDEHGSISSQEIEPEFFGVEQDYSKEETRYHFEGFSLIYSGGFLYIETSNKNTKTRELIGSE